MKSLLLTLLFLLSVSAHAQEITLSGMMHRSTLEGGCWYLLGDSGKRFELIGDAGIVGSLKVDGQHVILRVVPAKGATSICMIGEIVRVVRRIDSVRAPIDPPISSMRLTGTVHRTKAGIWYLKTSSGLRYEFKDAPEKPYRHAGMTIDQKFRVLFDRNSTHEGMNALILSNTLKQTPNAKQKTYDPR